MRAGATFLLVSLVAVLTLSSCVAGHRQSGDDGPSIALEPSEQPQPHERGDTRPIPYRPEALSVGSARLAYVPSLQPAPRKTIEVSAAPPPLPVSTPQRHIVAPGETLFAIARTRLGDESRWRDILAANPGLQSAQLKTGQTLNLPR